MVERERQSDCHEHQEEDAKRVQLFKGRHGVGCTCPFAVDLRPACPLPSIFAAAIEGDRGGGGGRRVVAMGGGGGGGGGGGLGRAITGA